VTRPAASAYVFDRAAAAKAVDFFEDYLSHVKGELAGQPLKLAPWQKHIIRDLFGTKRRRDGLRRYRTAYITLPRKNAKSTLGAGLALYLLLADEEPGAEIVSAAGDRAQAAIVFDIARSMVEANAELRSRVEIYQRSLVVRRTGASTRSLAARRTPSTG
jgi:phage terminase large subunit-like protein